MKITETKIAELKSQHGKLYKVKRKGADYVFRMPTLSEWKMVRQKDTSFSANDKIVDICLVFPALSEVRQTETTDPYLVESLGTMLFTFVLKDDDDDEDTAGKETTLLANGEKVRGFAVKRRGTVYYFRMPTRKEWKQLSKTIQESAHKAVDMLVFMCKTSLTNEQLTAIQEKDVAFVEQVGAPFLGFLVKDITDNEGEEL